MKRYELSFEMIGNPDPTKQRYAFGLVEATGHSGYREVYLASEVDARIADATARIGRQEARVMYLERRLFECESAMLMAHDAGRAKYMNEYPEPLEAPSPY